MILGYARVSTEDQKLDAQTDALTAAGAERIFAERSSGSVHNAACCRSRDRRSTTRRRARPR